MKITQELIKAARLIRNFCDENECAKCPFYNRTNWRCGLQKYGSLPLLWEPWLTQAFAECFRVLKRNGMLLFKWCDEDIPHKLALKCALPYKPLLGDKTGKTWTFFVKSEEFKQ